MGVDLLTKTFQPLVGKAADYNFIESNNFLKAFVPVYAYEFHDPNAPNVFQPLIGFSCDHERP